MSKHGFNVLKQRASPPAPLKLSKSSLFPISCIWLKKPSLSICRVTYVYDELLMALKWKLAIKTLQLLHFCEQHRKSRKKFLVFLTLLTNDSTFPFQRGQLHLISLSSVLPMAFAILEAEGKWKSDNKRRASLQPLCIGYSENDIFLCFGSAPSKSDLSLSPLGLTSFSLRQVSAHFSLQDV